MSAKPWPRIKPDFRRTPDSRILARACLAGLAVVLLGLVFGGLGSPSSPVASVFAADPVSSGAESCQDCHAEEAAAWGRSHHYRAMLPATPNSVLGAFDGQVLEQDGRSLRLFRDGDSYFVETEGPDGKSGVFPIAYTFGFVPLQQYLVALPDGRFQALTMAWDTSAHRWFDLYPGESHKPGDDLHWTGQQMTWNYMCANCHSTDLRRNYDVATDSYATDYSAVNVACGACHDDSRAHVDWARGGAVGPPVAPPVLAARDGATELQVCGACHMRRRALSDSWSAGAPLLDHFVPEILREGLYFADGQIEDEVFVVGSFLQSRMQRAGVTCSDCHEPHSGALRAQGNAVCTQCHNETPPPNYPGIKPLAYESPAHHFHPADSAGAACVSCHMPARTYMQVDPRRDHSFRIPRPDLSERLNSPSACLQCHEDQDNDWAERQIAEWYGPARRQEPHFGEALQLGRLGAPGAARALTALALDATQPSIARATAFNLLGPSLNAEGLATLRKGLGDPDPLVRVWTLSGLEGLPLDLRADLIGPLLSDPTLAVRTEAALLLAPLPDERLSPQFRSAFEQAAAEFLRVQMASAERAEAWHSLGVFHSARGDQAAAEAAYRKAIARDPRFVPAYVNLAELRRAAGDIGGEGALLRRAVASAPDEATGHFALGLYQARARDYSAALASLRRAADLAPDSARIAFVYAVALDSLGQRPAAIRQMTAALDKNPWNRQLLRSLAIMLAESGQTAQAKVFASRLVEVDPFDPDARTLLLNLQ